MSMWDLQIPLNWALLTGMRYERHDFNAHVHPGIETSGRMEGFKGWGLGSQEVPATIATQLSTWMILEVMEQLCGCLLYWCLGSVGIGIECWDRSVDHVHLSSFLGHQFTCFLFKVTLFGFQFGEFFCLTSDGVDLTCKKKDNGRLKLVGWAKITPWPSKDPI